MKANGSVLTECNALLNLIYVTDLLTTEMPVGDLIVKMVLMKIWVCAVKQVNTIHLCAVLLQGVLDAIQVNSNAEMGHASVVRLFVMVQLP